MQQRKFIEKGQAYIKLAQKVVSINVKYKENIWENKIRKWKTEVITKTEHQITRLMEAKMRK